MDILGLKHTDTPEHTISDPSYRDGFRGTEQPLVLASVFGSQIRHWGSYFWGLFSSVVSDPDFTFQRFTCILGCVDDADADAKLQNCSTCTR